MTGSQRSSVFETNLGALPQKARDFLRGARQETRFSMVISRSGLPVPRYLHATGSWRPVHSMIDPEAEASRIRVAEEDGFLIALGVGAGYHLRTLLADTSLKRLLLVEPFPGMLKVVLEHVDLTWLFEDPRVELLLSPEPETLRRNILDSFHPLVHGGLSIVPLRPIETLEPSLYARYLAVLRRTAEDASLDFSTQARFGHQWIRNAICNLPKLSASRILSQVNRGIVTAAGPSLEDSIPILEKSRANGTTVIATDTSWPVLSARGFTPDAILTIDSQLVSYHHFLTAPAAVPVILPLSAPPTIVRRVAMPFFVTTGHPFEQYLGQYHGHLPSIDVSGGNVTYAAVDLLKRLGAAHISLAGADFSYPEGKPYARETYVYRYLHLRAAREFPLLTGLIDLVFRTNDIEKTTRWGSIDYTPRFMDRYRNSVETLLSRTSHPPLFQSSDLATAPQGRDSAPPAERDFDWKAFLVTYLDDLDQFDPLRNDTSLPINHIALTLFPEALHLLATGIPPGEALEQARDSTMHCVHHVLAHF